MRKSYGLPYKGSKNAIAKAIVDFLPAGDTFVDLFAGGCAVTHAAIESGKWKHFIANDIKPGLTDFFKTCATGQFKTRTDWVSRERFFAEKDKDWYINTCWSFGNDCFTYIYGKDHEEFNKGYHEAVFFHDLTTWEKLGLVPPPV